MAESSEFRESRSRPLALVLGLAMAALAVSFPLVPEQYRPFNFAMFGAVGLFVAARVGFWPGIGLMLGSKLLCDLLLWQQKGQDPDHLPFVTVYASFALYAIIGWTLLRRSDSAPRIGLTALGASLAFFLVSNFISWVKQELPYGYTLGGLIHSYEMAIPFYRGTLFGDLLFTGVLFGAHAVLVRATAGTLEPVREEVRA